jgi:hypothetical protein
MNDANSVQNSGALATLKSAVANLVTDLAYLRRYVETANGIASNDPQFGIFKVAQEDFLSSIDTLAGQMQRRLALALEINS